MKIFRLAIGDDTLGFTAAVAVFAAVHMVIALLAIMAIRMAVAS